MGATDNIMDMFEAEKSGVFASNAAFMEEMKEVRKYYEFYVGFNTMDKNVDYGQAWKVPDNMDYTPTREIRNLTKKLINKQGRFMFGNPPDLLVKPINAGDVDNAESKRAVIDAVFDKARFWNKTAKAFVDSTIGKRTLVVLQANEGEAIGIRYYTMPEFTYTLDANDSSKLQSVQIAHQDPRTKGSDTASQLWHHYTYEMRTQSGEVPTGYNPDEELTCWLEYKLVDGQNNQLFAKPAGGTTSEPEQTETTIINAEGEEQTVLLEIKESNNTGLSQLPCYVILNEGLTGDTRGTSDVKDLMLIADNYNRTISDYRDALKFKMFEQPIIIDGDSNSIAAIKIAPNTIIDLKTDNKLSMLKSGSTQASVATMASSFSFKESAAWYLENAKKDMYEMMDMPMPEKVQDAPSAKSIKFLFYDLMARCENKWLDWEDAVLWIISFIEEAFEKVPNIQVPGYEDKVAQAAAVIRTRTVNSLNHNYPMPEDEFETKDIAIKEVLANVRSRKSYMRDFSDVENEDIEWTGLLEEIAQMEEQTAGVMLPVLNNSAAAEGGTTNEDKQETGAEEN